MINVRMRDKDQIYIFSLKLLEFLGIYQKIFISVVGLMHSAIN